MHNSIHIMTLKIEHDMLQKMPRQSPEISEFIKLLYANIILEPYNL